MATWILTGSPENYAATAARGYRLIGMKERRRLKAEPMEPGDRIVLYLTRVMAFAAAIRLTGPMFEDRAPVWPGKPGKADPYPWRFESEPELVLEEARGCPPSRSRTTSSRSASGPPSTGRSPSRASCARSPSRRGRSCIEAMRARTEAGVGR